jgi:hypothetical protein
MGTTVPDAGTSAPGVYLYAHCLRDHPGGVALLDDLAVPSNSSRYTLTAHSLLDSSVELNGRELKTGANCRRAGARGTGETRAGQYYPSGVPECRQCQLPLI